MRVLIFPGPWVVKTYHSMGLFYFVTGCDITAKAEHLNPGGSVKDRAALYLIKQAEENGLF